MDKVPIRSLKPGTKFTMPALPWIHYGEVLYHTVGSTSVLLSSIDRSGREQLEWSHDSRVVPLEEETE